MEELEVSEEARLKRELAALPKGSIVRRVIRGAARYYHQWREGGQTLSKYLKPSELDSLRALIERRKSIQRLLTKRGQTPFSVASQSAASRRDGDGDADGCSKRGQTPFERGLHNCVNCGRRIDEMAYSVGKMFRRSQVGEVSRFLSEAERGAIMLVAGLARSGKTTILRQAIATLSPEERAQAAYIAVCPAATPNDLTHDIGALCDAGFRYVFVDGIERSPAVADALPFIADLAAGMDIRLVLAISLRRAPPPRDPRISVVDATALPFAEFAELSGNRDFGFFLERGGAVDDKFATAASARDFLAAALDKPLRDALLAMSRIFIARLLSELGHSQSSHADSRVNADITVLAKSAQSLADRDSIERGTFAALVTLGIIAPFKSITVGADAKAQIEYLITMPGLRFQLARSIFDALLEEPECSHYGAAERKMIRDAVADGIRDRIMAEQTLLHAIRTRKRENVDVFRVRFAIGGFDMVIADSEELTCELYQVFRTSERNPRQTQYLNDQRKLDAMEHRYGMITAREVLYLGRDARNSSGVFHRNIVSLITFSTS